MKIEFLNDQESKRFFEEIGLVVPPTDGPVRRTHLQRQMWCMTRYVRLLCSQSMIRWPRSIDIETGNGAPDFILHFPDGTKLGLEVTEVTTRRIQRALTSKRRSATHTPSKTGGPGDENDRKLGMRFRAAMRTKLKKLVAGNWTSAEWYDVLGYENSPDELGDEEATKAQLLKQTKTLTIPAKKGVKLVTISLLFSGGDRLAYDVKEEFRFFRN